MFIAGKIIEMPSVKFFLKHPVFELNKLLEGVGMYILIANMQYLYSNIRKILKYKLNFTLFKLENNNMLPSF